MIRHSPHVRTRELRRTLSQLIFAWGSVVSAGWYALLTILGQQPLVDDHLTITAVVMLGSYLFGRFILDIWCQRAHYRARSRPENRSEGPDNRL